MLFSTITELAKRNVADLLVMAFWEKPKSAFPLGKKLDALVHPPIAAKDFTGIEGESTLLYVEGEKEKRLLLLGLGKEEKITVELLRKIYGGLAKFCQRRKIKTVNLLLPNIVQLRHVTVEECLKGICEGILSVNYSWTMRTEEEKSLLESVTLIGILPKYQPLIKKYEDVAESIYFARDLVNGNADIVTPQYLCEAAEKLSAKFPALKNTIFNRKRLEKEKFGLLLAVGRGAAHDPALIISAYKGNPKSKEHIVLVGKGITFDTGGLNMKPTGFMETMRSDMAGAACVLGTIAAVASLELKVNITAIVPTCENSVDANSFKPGDVFIGYSGKSVEITNTDAEGRLVLADALAYAVKNLKPTKLIDLATLTGAVSIALGDDVAGLLSNDDTLAEELLASSEITGENLWRLPLVKSYKEMMKSDIADLKNSSKERSAGTITGALFLEEFVEEMPWAHLDIAGVSYAKSERSYHPKNATGFGIRLLIEYLSK